jgi:hypothetical protein
LTNALADAAFLLKSNAANERLAQHLWNQCEQLLTFLCALGVDATNWCADLAIHFVVILRKVWGGSRTLGRCASAVRAYVGVADVLAAGAFGPAVPEPTPSRRGGSPGPALVTYRAKSRSVNKCLGNRLPAGSTRQSNRIEFVWVELPASTR